MNSNNTLNSVSRVVCWPCCWPFVFVLPSNYREITNHSFILLFILVLCQPKSYAQTKTVGFCIETDPAFRPTGRWYLTDGQRIIDKAPIRDSCSLMRVPASGLHTLTILLDGQLARRVDFRADTLPANYRFYFPKEFWTRNLDEVNVRSGSRFTQQGDTLMIRTDDVETRPFSDATALFENIAGLQVAADGSVSIMGKRVGRIDVDNRLLFGGDPKATLAMLRADMIEKMRVTETVSANGNATLSVSLALKKDKKNGQYGEIGGGLANAGRYDATARYNRLLPKAALNAFLSANAINQRGLSLTDLERLMGNSLKNDLTGATSVVGSLNQASISTNLNNRADNDLAQWYGVVPGVSQLKTGGLNLSLTQKKGELTGYLLAEHLNQSVETQQRTQNYLPPFTQTIDQTSQNTAKTTRIVGGLSGRWTLGESDIVAVRNQFAASSAKQQFSSQQTSLLLPDSLRNRLGMDVQDRPSNVTNQLQLAWSKRGNRAGSSTSAYVRHRIAVGQTQTDGRNELSQIERRFSQLRDQTSTDQLLEGQLVKSWGLTKRWVIETRATALRGWETATTSARNPDEPTKRSAATNGQLTTQSHVAQAELYALYRHKKVTLTGGAVAWAWAANRSFDTATVRLRQERFFPFLAATYRFSPKAKINLRLGSDITQPDLTSINPAIDSTRLQSVYGGRLGLTASPRQYVNLSTSFTLPHGFNLSTSLNLSEMQFPVVPGLRTDPFGLVATQPTQTGQPLRELNATFFLIKVGIQSPVTWALFGMYVGQNGYLFVNDQPATNQLQLFSATQTLKWRVGIERQLHLDWRVTAASNNDRPFNWQHTITAKADLKLTNRLYILPSADLFVTRSLGQTNSFLISGLRADYYAAANKSVRVSVRGINVLNQRVQTMISQYANGQSVMEQTILPRTVLFSVTLFPERWL